MSSALSDVVSPLVPQSRPETAAHAILRQLEAAGVDRVFGIPGGTICPLYDAISDTNIVITHCQHETMAVYMASGYARARGVPGVVLATSGPGILNAITGLAAARADEMPIVMIAGDVARAYSGRGALQDGGVAGLRVDEVVRPLVKHASVVPDARRATVAVRHALDLATSVPKGPVFLRIPMDVSRTEAGVTRYAAARPALPVADHGTCRDIAQQLLKARKPVVFVGVGARSQATGQAVRKLVELHRCPVISDLEGRGVVPDSHPLYFGTYGVGGWGAAGDLLDDADVVLTVGARLSDTTTNAWSQQVRPSAALIQLDHDPGRLSRAYSSDLAVLADIAGTIERVADLTAVPDALAMLDRDIALRDSRARCLRPNVERLSEGPHHPRTAVRALQEAFGSETLFTSDIGNHLLFASEALEINEPDGLFASIGLGGMGSGIGNAMGLALGLAGRKRVVSICGDGGTLMVGNELATCVLHRIPVVLAVFKDGRLGMVDHGVERTYGRRGDYDLPQTDFVAWAIALGARAMHLSSGSDFETAARLAGGGPLVLEIPIDPDARTLNVRDTVINFVAEEA